MTVDPQPDAVVSPAHRLTDAAVAEINRIYEDGGLRTALARCLVTYVFPDPDAASDRAHPTWSPATPPCGPPFRSSPSTRASPLISATSSASPSSAGSCW